MMKTGVYFIVLLCFVSIGYTAEGDVKLQWDASIDAPYLQSYRVYYYTISGDSGALTTSDYAKSYTLESGILVMVNVSDPKPITLDKSNTQITLHGLNVGKAYYFVVTAIDTRELESIPTDEVTNYCAAVINPEPNSTNAPWTLTGPNNYSRTGKGDQTINNLAPGDYTLTWEDVSIGWIKPSPAGSTQTLLANGTVTFQGTYTSTGIPRAQITPSALNFGYVQPGSYKDLTLEVKNIGTGSLTGTVSASDPFSIVSGGSYSLEANQTQQTVVRYTAPFQKGLHMDSLIFTGGDGIAIHVRGNNRNAGPPWLMLLLGGGANLSTPIVVFGTIRRQHA